LKNLHSTVALLLLMPMCAVAQTAHREVTVRIFHTQPPQELVLSSRDSGTIYRICAECKFKALPSRMPLKAQGNRIELANGNTGQPVTAFELLDITGPVQIQVRGLPSLINRQSLRIAAKSGRLLLTARVPLEDYVAYVLAGESGGITSAETLKAMSVAIRTYAVRFEGRHKDEGFDFCDTTHCQDARWSVESARLRTAADSTAGELLWEEGRPAATFYHRDCGGTTESASVAWPAMRATYLRQQSDPFCVARGRATWHSEINAAGLLAALLRNSEKAPNEIHSLVVAQRTPSGRVARLRIEGSASMEISAEALRRAIGLSFGWDRIRSDFYDVKRSGERFVFQGYGAGHGVGLCQTGAAQMSALGKSYEEILAFYYPGTHPGVYADGLAWQILNSERFQLYSTLPSDDQWIIPAAARALADAESRAGWKLDGAARLRVYPTLDAYRNSTGQPGWVAASTRGKTIRLQPLRVLSAAGTLEVTLRHEMMHLLVESKARKPLPLWFREGLVLALESSGPATNSPDDFSGLEALERALLSPANRREMERAYSAARSRVQKLIQLHGRAAVVQWLEAGIPTPIR
jgi:stage II sporulation protein D